MSAATFRRMAISLVIAVAVLETGDVALGIATHTLATQGAIDVVFTCAAFICGVVFAASGTLIVARQPTNTIGWILIAIPLTAAFAFVVGDYATLALVTRGGAAPFGRFAAWVDRWAIVPTLCMFLPLFLLFPDGRIPSRRWRPVLWLTIGAPALTTLAFALAPGRMTGAFADLTTVQVSNPVGLNAAAGMVNTLTIVGGALCALTAFLVGASLISRYRTRQGDERQQIKWLALVGVAFLVELILAASLGAALGDSPAGDVVGNVLFSAMFFTLAIGIPVACAVAVLRYRLYDLDVVVRKTLVVGALAVFVTVVYSLIVAGIGTAVGARGSTLLSFAAAVALAVLFQPARDRARRLADRLVYGRRATPYEVLSEFSEHVAGAYSTEEALPRMARLLAQGTGATAACVWLRVGGELVPAARFPDSNGSSPTEVTTSAPADRSMPTGGPVFPVLHRGEMLGAVGVEMSPSDPLTPPKETLIRDFASQAGHVLRNVKLVEDLKASRARLVATQDAERRTLERNIHDGAQQQLVALAVKSKLAAVIARSKNAPRTETLLEEVRSGAQEALEGLRDVARGIYPPLLADKGLAAALDALARKSAIAVAFRADGALERYPRETESTFYFCVLEALRNAAEYAEATQAEVRLFASQGELQFEVVDDGQGFDPAAVGYGTGLQSMADRLDVLGGGLEVRSAPGRGATVTGRIPKGTVPIAQPKVSHD